MRTVQPHTRPNEHNYKFTHRRAVQVTGGQWTKELIWIDEFEKKGYNGKAGILNTHQDNEHETPTKRTERTGATRPLRR